MQYSFVAPYIYNAHTRVIAKGIKYGSYDAIKEAAESMAEFVRFSDVLVPMPSHHGYATQTFKLCMAISQLTGAPVSNVLRGKARQPLYDAKKSGQSVNWTDLGLYIDGVLPEGKNIIVVDNVIDTGASAKAAIAAIGSCTVLAYAMTSKSFR